VHEEAVQAIRDLVKLREAQPDKGIYDPDLGRPVRYLFLRNGVLANPDYLFASPLARICEELAILNGEGKPAIHAHRFRHTLGTQLAEKGARTQTIMKILGHYVGDRCQVDHGWFRYRRAAVAGERFSSWPISAQVCS
jgi:integrase